MRKRKIATLFSAGLVVMLVIVASAASDPEEGVAVQTEHVAARNLVSTVPGSGRIEPKRKVDVSTDVSGRVTRLAVQEGDWVNQGDLLVTIDPARFQAALVRAQAGLSQTEASAEQAAANQVYAERELSRLQAVAGGGGFVSEAETERARAQVQGAASQARSARFTVDQARAALSEARDALAKATIVAPMSGRVTRVNIQEGETAMAMNGPGSQLLTIADLSEMEAHVVIDETDVPDVSVGDRAQVRIDAYTRRVFPGRVVRIANSALRGGAQESAGFRVVIALDRPPEGLRPELSASADVAVEERKGVLSVPILALTVRGPGGGPVGRTRGTEGVWVVRDNQAVFVPVQVGITGEQHFEVKRGLRAGEMVVAGPYDAVRSLQPGDVVRSEAPGAVRK
ncbi:MAG TPA: efflux RND transporter periplasmic adaptor subunit [Longimicrobium sp.]|jgi:HlyD family secretion protein